MQSETRWSIQLFGGLRVIGPEIEIDRFPTRRSALLLAKVSLSRSGSVGRDDLATALWPDDFLDATRLRLRQELNRLRETLGPAAAFLSSDRSWIQLDLSHLEIDAREFNRLLGAAKAEGQAAVKTNLRDKALALYQGPLLPEQSEDWVHAERDEFHSKYIGALIERTEELIAEGRAQEALADALKAVRSDPYHEPARLAAMRAFAMMGDVGGAIRQFVEYERAIVREFSSRPSETLLQYVAELKNRGATLASPGRREETPSMPADAARMTPLPVYLDSLVGREHELTLLKKWLTSHPPTRLATITGPGGVGKTRLAVAAAEAAASAFGDCVVFVGLADIEPGQKVAQKVREEIGIEGSVGEGEPLPGWGAEPCLIVLDNAEHVLEEAQQTVREILLGHPGVCFLVTSRQKLGLGGEQEAPLATLHIPDIAGDAEGIEASEAAQLFLQRARSVRPDFVVPKEQLESFVLLLERLDGLPLAIELAAARTGFLSPEQMLEGIDDRFTFLVSRRSDVGARHRSLRATIDWSFQGLDEELRKTLGLLAAFRGGCTIELAKKATGRLDIVDLLQDLIERSLVFRDETHGSIRFRMLDSIRHYLSEEMPLEQIAESRRIHAEVMAEHLYQPSRKLLGADQNKWFDYLREEMDNARAAIEWAGENDLDLAARLGAALWRFWCARGSPAEGALLLDRFLNKEPEKLIPEWGESQLGRGCLAGVMSEDAKQCHWMRRSVETYQSLNLPRSVSWARLNLCHPLLEEGHIAEAYEVATKALSDAQGINVPLIQHCMSRALARMGRSEEAMKLAEQSFAATLTSTAPGEVGRAYSELASIYVDCGRFDGVRGLLIEAVDRLRTSPIQNFLLDALVALAREELRAQNWAGFESAIAEARVISLHLHDHRSEASMMAFEARRLAHEGKGAEAIRRYEGAVRMGSEKAGYRHLTKIVRMLAADMAFLGFIEEAKRITEAVEGYRSGLGCGLSPDEALELASAVSRLKEELSPIELSSIQELTARVLAITAGIR